MPHALNLTLRIRQDPESQQKLARLKAIFPTHIQPKVDQALKMSEIVHFARILVIEDKYFQVLTEYDGDKQEYTEFFRQELPDVFKAVFELAEGAPPWSDLESDPSAFYLFAKSANVKALGTGDDPEEGYLFSALGNTTTVKQIKEKMG
jgi:hypothetical protein